MKTSTETRRILNKLEAQHPEADTELRYRNAFELLVATILSAQSTDQRVNLVTPELFTRYPNAKAMAKATAAELEPQIHSTGFFRAKSKALIGMAQAVVEKHGGQVPAKMDALVKLPGVGRKTANVVLGHALGVPGLAVDRHVLRVANRIGIASRTPNHPASSSATATSICSSRAYAATSARPRPLCAESFRAEFFRQNGSNKCGRSAC